MTTAKKEKKKTNSTLTKKQQRTFNAVSAFVKTHYRMPTLADVMDMMRVSSITSAFRMIERLAAKGYIEKDEAGRICALPALAICPTCGRAR